MIRPQTSRLLVGAFSLLLALPCVVGCSPSAGPLSFTFDFEDGTVQGFVVDGSDFEEPTRGTVTPAVQDLEAPLTGKGLHIIANNQSDDLWAFIARPLTTENGIIAGQTYDASLSVELASNIPSGCAGVGGNPDGLFFKGGVVAVEPTALPADDAGYITFSIDKGNQDNVGQQALDFGTIGTSGSDCTGENPWEILERSGTMQVTATVAGELWIYLGTDSAFESASEYAYASVVLQLLPL